MTTETVVPACLMAAAPVLQQPHLEGDASLATEILPGPPPLESVQQVGLPRKDHRKTAHVLSYLPVSDPGTTYGANTVSTMAAATAEVDGPRRKRARLDKRCVYSPLLRRCVTDPYSFPLTLLLAGAMLSRTIVGRFCGVSPDAPLTTHPWSYILP